MSYSRHIIPYCRYHNLINIFNIENINILFESLTVARSARGRTSEIFMSFVAPAIEHGPNSFSPVKYMNEAANIYLLKPIFEWNFFLVQLTLGSGPRLRLWSDSSTNHSLDCKNRPGCCIHILEFEKWNSNFCFFSQHIFLTTQTKNEKMSTLTCAVTANRGSPPETLLTLFTMIA